MKVRAGFPGESTGSGRAARHYNTVAASMKSLRETSGSHDDKYEDDRLLGRCGVQSSKYGPTFQRLPHYMAQHPRRRSSSYLSS
jgi:hypothetical protein